VLEQVGEDIEDLGLERHEGFAAAKLEAVGIKGVAFEQVPHLTGPYYAPLGPGWRAYASMHV